jgi:hypothetical protein
VPTAPYREVAARGGVRFLFALKGSAGFRFGVAFLVLLYALFVATGVAFVSVMEGPQLLARIALGVGWLAAAAFSFRATLRELWWRRGVDVDPAARVVRVYAPGPFGLAVGRKAIAFADIRAVESDSTGRVRLRLVDTMVDVVDERHPCSADDARILAARLHELVLGTPVPEEAIPSEPPPSRNMRVELPEPEREMDEDASGEQPHSPRRRDGGEE